MRYRKEKVKALVAELVEKLGDGWSPVITGFHTGGYKAVKDGIEVLELRAKFMGNIGYLARLVDSPEICASVVEYEDPNPWDDPNKAVSKLLEHIEAENNKLKKVLETHAGRN